LYHKLKRNSIKGFILKHQLAKGEDIIVTVLSKDRVEKYYRFYGARHSILQMGYLIDFESQESSNFLPRIRSISHNGFSWLYNREKLFMWHKFISIFEPHFKDVKEIDPIYYDTLLDCAIKWDKQSPKRLIVEAYTKLLSFEGRLQPLNRCVICNQKIEDTISLVGNFMPAHSSCAKVEPIKFSNIEHLFKTNSTIWLDDNAIERLYLIALKSF
jgi:recombinational DNA repair protein (RecF pathway)